MSAAERHAGAHCTARGGAMGGLTVQPGEGGLAAQQRWQPSLSVWLEPWSVFFPKRWAKAAIKLLPCCCRRTKGNFWAESSDRQATCSCRLPWTCISCKGGTIGTFHDAEPTEKIVDRRNVEMVKILTWCRASLNTQMKYVKICANRSRWQKIKKRPAENASLRLFRRLACYQLATQG